MEHKITFSKDKNIHYLSTNRDTNFFGVLNIVFEIDSFKTYSINELASLRIEIQMTSRKGAFEGSTITFIGLTTNPEKTKNILNINKIISHENYSTLYDTIELKCDFNGKDVKFDLFYININLNINIDNPFKAFENHIDDNWNTRILFSAPFGQGKTTFLKKIFEEKKEKYEVFHLFPVNYAVAKNEDIFQYIKCELLFQLLSKDVKFDNIVYNFKELLPQFIIDDPIRAFSPLVPFLPKIGKSVFEFAKSLQSLLKEFKKYQTEIETNDQKKAQDYIKDLYEKEGSIYEDNFYTQLINQLIKQIKGNGKTTVLLIDDLDRMDPDHIFRILNVFAAHFDSPAYNENINKFGFDKIIMVADYSNIKNIFHHKFGSKTGFEGYIDKFYSKEIFFYDNVKAISVIIDEIRNIVPHSYYFNVFWVILTDLLFTGNLSLREVIKIQKMDLRKLFYGSDNPNDNSIHISSPFAMLNYFRHLYILNQLTNIETIITKIENCKNNIAKSTKIFIENKNDYHSLSANAFISLIESVRLEEGINYKNFDNDKIVDFSIHLGNTFGERYYTVIKDSIKVTNGASIFNEVDFYNLLGKVAKKYKEVGGLTGSSNI